MTALGSVSYFPVLLLFFFIINLVVVSEDLYCIVYDLQDSDNLGLPNRMINLDQRLFLVCMYTCMHVSCLLLWFIF